MVRPLRPGAQSPLRSLPCAPCPFRTRLPLPFRAVARRPSSLASLGRSALTPRPRPRRTRRPRALVARPRGVSATLAGRRDRGRGPRCPTSTSRSSTSTGANHHNGEMHSIGFALLAAGASALFFRCVAGARPLAAALAVFLGLVEPPRARLPQRRHQPAHRPPGAVAVLPRLLQVSRAASSSTSGVHLPGRRCATTRWRGPGSVRSSCRSSWRWRYKSRRSGGLSWHEGSRASR